MKVELSFHFIFEAPFFEASWMMEFKDTGISSQASGVCCVAGMSPNPWEHDGQRKGGETGSEELSFGKMGWLRDDLLRKCQSSDSPKKWGHLPCWPSG